MKIANFITLSTLVAMLAPTTAYAQQLPNGDFEGEWVDCYPWVSDKQNTSINSVKSDLFGLQPKGWNVSDVLGTSFFGSYVGTTVIAAQAEGNNGSASALKLINTPNPFMPTQVVPAYVSLGTPWSTSVVTNAKDGGTFGGIDFSFLPDAISFDFKRQHTSAPEDASDDVKATYVTDEPATVLVYSWKGTWSQAEVPGEVSLSNPAKVTMINRERNVLGIETAQGGTVTATEDAQLISKLIYSIDGDYAEWTHFEQPIEYLSDATPEKFNVIIASNDYFNSEKIGNANEITLDNVKLVYYSRLKSLSVNGTAIALEDGKYNYTVDFEMPEGETVAYEVLGKSATAKVDYYPAVNKATVTVTNVDADRDGEKSHVYTIEFANAVGGDIKSYDGFLDINMNGTDLAQGQNATIKIIPTSDNTCQFMLPDFTLEGLGALGDILIHTVNMTTDANSTTTYVGEEKGLSLAEGDIIADVALKGTIDVSGNIDMDIDVSWMGIPIAVKFYTKKTSGIDLVGADADAAPEYYTIGGLRVANPAPGTIYIVRRGNKVTKEIIR